MEGSITDVLAVLASARARDGMAGLRSFVAEALGEKATESEASEAAELAWEIIESVPLIILHARSEADTKGIADLVAPVLSTAEAYYLHPVDLIPEMTQGLAGLLDDSYLVMRLLEHLCRSPEPLFDIDLDYPLHFLGRLLGPDISKKLDELAKITLLNTVDGLTRFEADDFHHA